MVKRKVSLVGRPVISKTNEFKLRTVTGRYRSAKSTAVALEI